MVDRRPGPRVRIYIPVHMHVVRIPIDVDVAAGAGADRIRTRFRNRDGYRFHTCIGRLKKATFFYTYGRIRINTHMHLPGPGNPDHGRGRHAHFLACTCARLKFYALHFFSRDSAAIIEFSSTSDSLMRCCACSCTAPVFKPAESTLNRTSVPAISGVLIRWCLRVRVACSYVYYSTQSTQHRIFKRT